MRFYTRKENIPHDFMQNKKSPVFERLKIMSYVLFIMFFCFLQFIFRLDSESAIHLLLSEKRTILL